MYYKNKNINIVKNFKFNYLFIYLSYIFFITKISRIYPKYYFFGIFQIIFIFKLDKIETFGERLKKYFVIFPTFLLNYYNAYPESKLLKIKFILNIILFLNVLMVGIGELLLKNRNRQLNGLLLIINSILTPRTLDLGIKSKSFGFNKNILWQFNNFILLTNMYLFSDYIENSRFPLLYSITIPLIMSIKYNDSTYWTLYRVQSIFTLLLIDTLFPKFHIIFI